MLRNNPAARILVAALALGMGADLLFYNKPFGISVPIFIILWLGALIGLGRLGKVNPRLRNLWLVAPMVFFATMAAVRANAFLSMLNLFAVLVLLGLVTYFYAEGHVDRLGLAGYAAVFFTTLGNAFVRTAPVIPAALDFEGVRKRGLPRLLPVLRGLVIALPVLSLFTCLLASADMVFARYLFSWLNLDLFLAMNEFFAQLTIVLIVAWFAAGGLVYALSRRQEADAWAAPGRGALTAPFSIGFTETVTMLVLVDLLFLAFGWVQFAYLFGGQANITMEGLTYADYARRGFFELVAVSVMTMGLILGLHRVAWRETREQARAFNVLSSLMVALVMVLLASALQRMLLYEDAYGYTELRLYVKVFEVWLAVAFGWLLVALWFRPERFAIGGFVAALGFLVTLNLANPDALIAQQNFERYHQMGKLDAYYLSQLSDDAVPGLVGMIDQLKGGEQTALSNNLIHRLERMEREQGWREVPAFHLSRWEAYRALAANREELGKHSATGAIETEVETAEARRRGE